MIGVDYLLHLDHAARPGEVSEIEQEWRIAGGEAVNCALALAKWGARVALGGNPYGTDSNGRALLQAMAKVPSLAFMARQMTEIETPYSVLLMSWNTPRIILTRHSGVSKWDHDWLEVKRAGQVDEWPKARLATCDGHWSTATYQLARELAARGTPLIAQDALLNESVAPLAEIVLLTDAFWPRENEKRLLREARSRADEWGNTVIITRGERGGLWCKAGNTPQTFAPVKVRGASEAGSIGAGDIFRAGLLWSRLCGYEWEHTLRFASAAAALKCTCVGGYEALPEREEIEILAG
jgi:sugar/nucleoside kinase (ribokinase family)